MFTQRNWRIAGAIAITICALMAVFGTRIAFQSLFNFAVYWTVCLMLLMVTLYIALIDIKYIRVEQAIAHRELFRETVGDEDFQKKLLEAAAKAALEEAAASGKQSPTNGSAKE